MKIRDSSRLLRRCLATAAIFLAACAQLPPTPEDIQAKKFEPVPGQSVVYLLRDVLDSCASGSPLAVNDTMMGSTYRGTYLRWELAPGTHLIRGYASDMGQIMLTTQAGRIYYVEQQVFCTQRAPEPRSWFFVIPEEQARRLILQRLELANSR